MMSREIQPKRKYELKKRADEMAETHRRITEAAIELHGTVGPARTTLSAVAKRAGVERRTLYRHFPTEADLFAACSTHYFAAYPWPDLDAWRAIGDPQRRLEHALDELYAYYERTGPMLGNVLRDADSSSSPATPSRRCTRSSTRRPGFSASAGPCAAGDGSSCGRPSVTPSTSRSGARCRPAASDGPTRCG